MAKLKISAGKKYRTVAGDLVRIYATDGFGSHPIHGAYKDEGSGWQADTWMKDGTYCLPSGTSGYDLKDLKEKVANAK